MQRSLMSRSMNSRILTGQQPVVFLQLKAVEDPLDMLKLLLLLLLQLFLQGSAAFLLLLFLIQRLLWKETRIMFTPQTRTTRTQSCTSLHLLPPPPKLGTNYSLSQRSPRWL